MHPMTAANAPSTAPTTTAMMLTADRPTRATRDRTDEDDGAEAHRQLWGHELGDVAVPGDRRRPADPGGDRRGQAERHGRGELTDAARYERRRDEEDGGQRTGDQRNVAPRRAEQTDRRQAQHREGRAEDLTRAAADVERPTMRLVARRVGDGIGHIVEGRCGCGVGRTRQPQHLAFYDAELGQRPTTGERAAAATRDQPAAPAYGLIAQRLRSNGQHDAQQRGGRGVVRHAEVQVALGRLDAQVDELYGQVAVRFGLRRRGGRCRRPAGGGEHVGGGTRRGGGCGCAGAGRSRWPHLRCGRVGGARVGGAWDGRGRGRGTRVRARTGRRRGQAAQGRRRGQAAQGRRGGCQRAGCRSDRSTARRRADGRYASVPVGRGRVVCMELGASVGDRRGLRRRGRKGPTGRGMARAGSAWGTSTGGTRRALIAAPARGRRRSGDRVGVCGRAGRRRHRVADRHLRGHRPRVGGAVFGGAVFGGAVFGGAVFGGAVLGGTILGGAVLGGAGLGRTVVGTAVARRSVLGPVAPSRTRGFGRGHPAAGMASGLGDGSGRGRVDGHPRRSSPAGRAGRAVGFDPGIAARF